MHKKELLREFFEYSDGKMLWKKRPSNMVKIGDVAGVVDDSNGYRRISLFKHQIEVPKVPLREYVDVHMVPDTAKEVMHIRIWWNEEMVNSVSLPLKGFRVHF